jgi:AbrB family looped-hinge helix DNA binding protein
LLVKRKKGENQERLDSHRFAVDRTVSLCDDRLTYVASASPRNKPKALIVTVSSKGQVVLPKAVREHLGIAQGDKVTFGLEAEGKVALKALKYPTIAALRGAAGTLAIPLTWAAIRQIARADQRTATQP